MNKRALRVLEYDKIIDMLVNEAESELGKKIAKNLTPDTDISLVFKKQAETEEAFNIIMSKGNPPLGGIHNISNELRRADMGGVLLPRELLRISDSLRTARRLKKFIKNDKVEKSVYPIIKDMIDCLNQYRRIEESITSAIISEEEISDNASIALRNIRRNINMKNSSIKNKLNSIINSSSINKYLQEDLVTIRNDRYVVPVKQEYRANFPGLVHDQSSSGATLFIEPMAIVRLNNELKELQAQEKNEIERILSELTGYVADESEGIMQNQNILGELDFIFAKGKFAIRLNAIKPKLNDRRYIDIKKARHPLLNPEQVVPIDVNLGNEFSTLVITGPNTGGKTVSLKTIGLLTLMAQSGLHIPANHGTEMGVFNNVFADIGDEQSIEQSLSTFSSHMTNIVDIIKSVSINDLVLFDELGAGTDPTEGAALAMSILDYLYNKEIRTVATTHYSELKVYAITTEGVQNASVEFNVNTLSPTYRLLIGVPGKSNAFEISKRLGLQDFIIDKARQLLSKDDIEFEDILAKIEKDRLISDQNREETERLRLEVSKLKNELVEKKEKIDKNRNKVIREAKLEAKKILQNAKKEADTIVKDLRDMSVEIRKEHNKKIHNSQDRLREKIGNVQENISQNILNKKNSNPPKKLKVGDNVLILNLNQKGMVITEPDDKGNLMVQAGIMKITVNITDLQRTKGDDENKVIASTKGMIKAKSRNIKNELDLRGKNLEEAMLDVDKYLDDVYISGLNEVTIIHGKGTGILREGISQLLKRHRHVKSYRLGKYGEGGTGVTVVELK